MDGRDRAGYCVASGVIEMRGNKRVPRRSLGNSLTVSECRQRSAQRDDGEGADTETLPGGMQSWRREAHASLTRVQKPACTSMKGVRTQRVLIEIPVQSSNR